MPLFFPSLLAMDTRMVRQKWRSSSLRPENVGAVLGRGYTQAGRLLFGALIQVARVRALLKPTGEMTDYWLKKAQAM